MSRGSGRWLAVVSVVIAATAWVSGCSNGDDIVNPPPPPPPPGPPIVSDPVPTVAIAASAASITAQEADTDVAYVSLPPGTAPAGQTARILNLTRGDTIVVAVAVGGFDPAAIEAVAGDRIAIVVLDASDQVVFQSPVFVVAARRPPVVVRTNPPPRKRDVPLNSRIVVVFSEPIDAATLTNSSVQLHDGSQLIAGTLEFRDSSHVAAILIPNLPLRPATTYTLAVSAEIRDLDGDLLEEPVTVEFTTASSGAYEEYFVDATLPLSGDQIGDSVVVNYTVRVLDGDGGGIEAAIIRFRVSTGTVVPDTTTSGLGGLTTGRWAFAGIIGVLPADSTAELSACASNSGTRCDQYWPILLIGYRPP